jgi:hypothetical protein
MRALSEQYGNMAMLIVTIALESFRLDEHTPAARQAVVVI